MTPQKKEHEKRSSVEYRYNIPRHTGNVASLLRRTLEMYGPQVLEYADKSTYIQKFLNMKRGKGTDTTGTYKSRLRSFANFVYKQFPKTEFDAVIDRIKAGKLDPYEVLTDYSNFLQYDIDPEYRVKGNTVNERVSTTMRFLRFCKCPVNREDFKDNVSIPGKTQSEKEAIDHKEVAEFIAHAQSLRLQTAINFMAATGPRPIEAAAVRLRELELEKPIPEVLAGIVKEAEIPHITFRAEYAKTKVSRRRPLTGESAKRLKIWLAAKYAPHRTTVLEAGKPITKMVYPKPQLDDLIFAVCRPDGSNPDPQYLYDTISREFRDLLKTLGKDKREAGGKRHEITLHSFRRFVKSEVSDNVSSDYSEYLIGHKASTYYRRKEKEKIEAFRRAEPYITFLDPGAQQGYGKDVDAKLSEQKDQYEKQFAELRAEIASLKRAGVRAAENKEQVDGIEKEQSPPLIATGPGRKRARA
jgi:integrase